MAEQDVLDKMQRTDHDTLIRLETKVDSLTETIRSAVSELTGRVTDHETRLRVIEKSHDVARPEMMAGQVNRLEAQVGSWKTTMRAYAIAGGLISALVGFAATAIGIASGFVHR